MVLATGEKEESTGSWGSEPTRGGERDCTKWEGIATSDGHKGAQTWN